MGKLKQISTEASAKEKKYFEKHVMQQWKFENIKKTNYLKFRHLIIQASVAYP